MESSDFLTLLGISVAVWAIIPNKERKFIRLFFSKFDLLIILILIMVIHYLMAFNWILINWFPSLEIFTFEKSISSNAWAYMIAIGILFYSIIKVSFGFFSKSRRNELIELYTILIKEDEIDILISNIKKYHLKDIRSFLQSLSHLPHKEGIDIVMNNNETEHDIEYKKLLKNKRSLFAALVYGHIVQNESFIVKSANKYPEFFSEVFKGMETEEAADSSMVKLFLELIYEEKNPVFIQELRKINNDNAAIIEQDKNIEIPIISSLFLHTKVAVANNVWYPIGEKAIISLKYDHLQKEFLLQKYDSYLENEIWNQKIYIAIVYFNYMVRETIYRDSDYHMWLYYFKSFTESIIKYSIEKKQSKCKTFAHHLIDEQITILLDWLNLCKELRTNNRIIDTVKCLGSIITLICKTKNNKLHKSFKIDLLSSVIDSYFEFSLHPDNIATNTAREWMDKMFINPKNLDIGKPDTEFVEYIDILNKAWRKFDKIPYSHHFDNGSIGHFSKKVLNNLNL